MYQILCLISVPILKCLSCVSVAFWCYSVDEGWDLSSCIWQIVSLPFTPYKKINSLTYTSQTSRCVNWPLIARCVTTSDLGINPEKFEKHWTLNVRQFRSIRTIPVIRGTIIKHKKKKEGCDTVFCWVRRVHHLTRDHSGFLWNILGMQALTQEINCDDLQLVTYNLHAKNNSCWHFFWIIICFTQKSQESDPTMLKPIVGRNANLWEVNWNTEPKLHKKNSVKCLSRFTKSKLRKHGTLTITVLYNSLSYFLSIRKISLFHSLLKFHHCNELFLK